MIHHRISASLATCLLLLSAAAHAQSAPAQPPAPTDTVAPGAPTPPPDASPTPEGAHLDQRAKELYAQADVAYAEGKYAMALVLFRESYALSNRALILIAMANSQERLGDLKGALENLQSYATQVDISQEPNIGQRILSLESRIKEIEAKAEQDRLAREKQVETTPLPEPIVDNKGVGEAAPASKSSRWPWIVVGSGSAALVAGATFAMVARSARNKADDFCSTAMGGDVLCLPGAQKYLDRDSTYSVLADISIGVGLAAVTTGVLFLVLPQDSDHDTDASVAVGQDSMSLTFQGSF